MLDYTNLKNDTFYRELDSFVVALQHLNECCRIGVLPGGFGVLGCPILRLSFIVVGLQSLMQCSNEIPLHDIATPKFG